MRAPDPAGASALLVCETAGEASTLSAAEQELIIRTAADTARGRSRIIGGAVTNATSHAIELARRAEAAGADVLLALVPYYNKPMQEGMLAHFRAIAASTGLPIILHDVPPRTFRPLADETLLRLAEPRQFIALRDGSGDVSPIDLKILQSLQEDPQPGTPTFTSRCSCLTWRLMSLP